MEATWSITDHLPAAPGFLLLRLLVDVGSSCFFLLSIMLQKGNDSDDADDDGGALRTITFVMTGQCAGDDKRKAKSKETTNQFNYYHHS